MKVKNIGKSDFSGESLSVKPGENSANLDDILARQLVAENPGHLALAPESEHTAEELAHADEKKKEEPEPEPHKKTTTKPPTKTGS